jgi:putative addiction module CopG family antidote
MSVKTQNSTVHASLTPTLSLFIDQLLETGLYGNVSEIIREALREKYQKEYSQLDKIIKLKQAIKIGLDQAENGEFVETDINTMLNRVKKRV